MKPIRCGFRRDVVRTSQGETASCELLRRLIADDDGEASRVDRSACEFCVAEGRIHPKRMMQVIGSGVLAATAPDASDDPSRVSLRHLADFAVSESAGGPLRGPSAAVDIVLPVERLTGAVDRCLSAWLQQLGVFPIVHLIAFHDDPETEFRRYADNPSVRVHSAKDLDFPSAPKLPSHDSMSAAFVAAHALTRLPGGRPGLEAPFLAFGCQLAVPTPTFLSNATRCMMSEGLEWCAGQLRAGHSLLASSNPEAGTWQRSVQAEASVVRRSLWVDLGGCTRSSGAPDVDFFARAARQHRASKILGEICAEAVSHDRQESVGECPGWFTDSARSPFTLHAEAHGFEAPRQSCDVILPFRGQLDFVEQAIESILSQENVDLVLHLIDDATPGNIDEWLRRQQSDPRVRVYRNRENLGQFLSFNNVIRFCESRWIVTQDGDDVSLPGRLSESLQIADLCDADLLAASSVMDGPIERIHRLRHLSTNANGKIQHHRISFPPRLDYVAYFLENPTLVHRRDFFERMGGFTDFADVLRNRTTIDTDYMIRALHAGANIVACRRLAVKYRIHSDSAVNHESTRIGSPIRNWAQREFSKRLSLYRRGGIDPKVFGALGRGEEITERWEG